MSKVYLLVMGECEYDAHENLLAVCESVDVAKSRAQRWLEERWDVLDGLPHRKGKPEGRYDLRWLRGSDGDWTAYVSNNREQMRIEEIEVERAATPEQQPAGDDRASEVGV